MQAMDPSHGDVDFQLLRPSQFNWADDVEDELMADAAELDGVEDGIEEGLTFFPELNGSTSDMEEGEEEEREEEEGRSEGKATVPEEPRRTGSSSGPLIINGSTGVRPDPDASNNLEPVPPRDFEAEVQAMEADIYQEFKHRRGCLRADYDGDIHHFNWFGYPVCAYSATPAAVSLLFILADPKVPAKSDEWRLQSIMRRATAFIDPVVVFLGTNGWEDLCRGGSNLVRWATGRTHKMYTPHGSWQMDAQEIEDMTIIDDGEMSSYAEASVAFSNGFVEELSIRSRKQWEQSRVECLNRAARNCCSSKIVRRHSPLRQSMTPDDFPDEEVNEAEEPGVEKLAARSLRKTKNSECQLGGLRKRYLMDDNDSESDSSSSSSSDDTEPTPTSTLFPPTVEEWGNALCWTKPTIVRKTFLPGLSSIIEEDELTREGVSTSESEVAHGHESASHQGESTHGPSTGEQEPTQFTQHTTAQQKPAHLEPTYQNHIGYEPGQHRPTHSEPTRNDHIDVSLTHEPAHQHELSRKGLTHRASTEHGSTHEIRQSYESDSTNPQPTYPEHSHFDAPLEEPSTRRESSHGIPIHLEPTENGPSNEVERGNQSAHNQGDQNDQRNNQRCVSDTQTLCESNNEATSHNSNDRQSGVELNQLNQTVSISPVYPSSTGQKNKVKDKLRRISSKTRNILRSKSAQFSSLECPTSSKPSLSTSTPSNGASTRHISTTVTWAGDRIEIKDCGHPCPCSTPPSHFINIHESYRRLSGSSSPKKLATKVKKAFSRSPPEYAAAAPQKKRRSFAGGAKDFVLYDGVWAFKFSPNSVPI